MKINAVFTKPKLNKSKPNFDSSLLYSVIVIVLAFISGTLIYIIKNNFIETNLIEAFQSFILNFSKNSFVEIFFSSLATEITFILVIVLFGTSFLGMIPIYVFTFIKMSGVAVFVTYLFSSYAITGLEYYIIVLLPSTIIQIFYVLIAQERCSLFSIQIKNKLFNDTDVKLNFKNYAIETAFILLLIVASSLIKTTCIKLFSSLFEL